MKTQDSLEASRQASVKRSHLLAKTLVLLLNEAESVKAEDIMPEIREVLSELNQRVHEYNAYRNALETA